MKTSGLLALLVVLAFSVPVHAQGGGASSTGTIQGRVSDGQGAAVPGVSPSPRPAPRHSGCRPRSVRKRATTSLPHWLLLRFF